MFNHKRGVTSFYLLLGIQCRVSRGLYSHMFVPPGAARAHHDFSMPFYPHVQKKHIAAYGNVMVSQYAIIFLGNCESCSVTLAGLRQVRRQSDVSMVSVREGIASGRRICYDYRRNKGRRSQAWGSIATGRITQRPDYPVVQLLLLLQAESIWEGSGVIYQVDSYCHRQRGNITDLRFRFLSDWSQKGGMFSKRRETSVRGTREPLLMR